MTGVHFDAILAKNLIARELRQYLRPIYGQEFERELNANYIIELLKDIELYTGEGNQPSVVDIITSEVEL